MKLGYTRGKQLKVTNREKAPITLGKDLPFGGIK